MSMYNLSTSDHCPSWVGILALAHSRHTIRHLADLLLIQLHEGLWFVTVSCMYLIKKV